MRKNGNTKSNAFFNPEPSKNPVPIASEEMDSLMERHIRAKYEYQSFRRDSSAGQSSSASSFSSGASTQSYGLSLTPTNTTHHTGASSSSSNGSYPPPANSTPTTFAAAPSRQVRRSASSGFPSRRLSIGLFRTASPSGAKVSQILGATPYTDSGHIQKRDDPPSTPNSVTFPHGMVAMSPGERYAEQLKNLRDMGFNDTSRNLDVLQATNGKILETVEVLIRLGKGQERRPSVPPKPQAKSAGSGTSFGISVQKDPFQELDKEEQPLPPLPSHEPQRQNSNGYQQPQQQMAMANGYGQWNGQANGNGFQDPFAMNGMQQALPNGLQQQQMSNPYTNQSPSNPYAAQLQNANPFGVQVQQQPSTNPYVQQTQRFSPTNTGQPQPQQQQQYNPFLASSQAQQSQQNTFSTPFSAPPQQTQSSWPPQQMQQPQQQQLLQNNPFQTTTSQSQPQTPAAYNPYLQQQQLQQQQQFQQFQQQQQQPNYTTYPATAPVSQLAFGQQWQPQPPAAGKQDILALYGAPHLAPQPNPSPQKIENKPLQPPQPPQRANTTPSAGSKNPFLPGGGAAAAAPGMAGMGVGMGAGVGGVGRHMSKESLDFGGWQSGRHSPDAFASLAFGGR